MEITYLGHSCFRIKAKSGTVVTDPYNKSVGLTLPTLSADIVTVSHPHDDHNNTAAVAGTARRKQPFVVDQAGEYEVEGVSIFGYQTKHDELEGEERGENTVFTIIADDLRIVHLGDLGHMLSDKLIEELNGVDVLMIPVGGVYTIDAKMAATLAAKIEPSYILPMHYKTDKHDEKTFGTVAGLQEFVTHYGHGSRVVSTLTLNKMTMPEDLTEVIVFE